ncbi:uncharacterized protein TRUGW13939_02060 [Talaromyces rugulosus]|uniref:Transcription factor domain-containing protein n=1 Tax=Talaromyces rugulosus TaxID=121627 RepID=A0A7H8QM15_TALRU|nr:uncharacterized protein TRUGW13939_02060 [Talaromyces rugulosus]QKX54970.1 hypothetical protein TRUGW13939_02060 [Talaromyces rugulosus]
MILSIGLNIDKINDLNLSPRDRSTGLRDRESINLWWSAAIFERVILCDIPGCKQAPILRFPGPEAALPPDLSPEEGHSESIHFPSRPTLSELEAKNISGFGRQIQVTHLLDHLLSILINPVTNKQHHIAILQSLDQRIQMFMAVLICDCDHEWRYYCGAIGIATRSLFLLHEHIQTLHPSSDIKWLQKCSVAGLGFVTKVMVDVAHDHLERVTPTNAGALPLLCAYNLHAAIKQIKFEQIQKKANNDKDHNADLNSLLALDNICYQRWCKRP